MRILIAEDQRVGQLLLHAFAERYGECDLAANGLEAVECFERALTSGRRYDLVFLDIMMPELDGQEALKRMRALETKHGITPSQGAVVIVTTALGDEETIFEAHVSGCAAYLVKPFSRQEFERILGELGFTQRGGGK